jgi:hypothetical protein
MKNYQFTSISILLFGIYSRIDEVAYERSEQISLCILLAGLVWGMIGAIKNKK